MKLNFSQICDITLGSVYTEEQDGMAVFHRFTKEQEEIYKETSSDYYKKSLSTSGVKLSFKTDSRNMFLKIDAVSGSSRKYFSVDVFVNGEPIGFIDNFTGTELPLNYTKIELPLGEYSKNFDLGEGTKTVTVHLPWSVAARITEISLDDGSSLEAVRPQKKLVSYGDSITHGYDALRPSNRYPAKLAEALGAEEYNRGIGGERFFPPIAEPKDNFEPDYITVAYGTNDWSKVDEATFRATCRGFYLNLSRSNPNSKIFALTPIWRKDLDGERAFGPFENIVKVIEEEVRDLENVTVINGMDFVTHDSEYYADLRLHPNDAGFEQYFRNLNEKIKL